MSRWVESFTVDDLADYQVMNGPPYSFGGVPEISGGTIGIAGGSPQIFGLIAKNQQVEFPCRVAVHVTTGDRDEAGYGTAEWEVGLSDIAWSNNPYGDIQASAGFWRLTLWGPPDGPIIGSSHGTDIPDDFWMTLDVDASGITTAGVWSAVPPASGGTPDLDSVASAYPMSVPLGTVMHPYLTGSGGMHSRQDDWSADVVGAAERFTGSATLLGESRGNMPMNLGR